MLPNEAIGRESQSNEFPELEPFKMAAEELIEYFPHIYHPKIDTELEKSYQKVKTRTFAYDNKSKCQIKRDYSSSQFSLAASAILFRELCRPCQISSGRDGRASKIGRRPIEHTWIAFPILATLPLAQTNRLSLSRPARVAQWWACRTRDLVVVSSIRGWGDFSFRRIFSSHLCRSMWEK